MSRLTVVCAVALAIAAIAMAPGCTAQSTHDVPIVLTNQDRQTTTTYTYL